MTAFVAILLIAAATFPLWGQALHALHRVFSDMQGDDWC